MSSPPPSQSQTRRHTDVIAGLVNIEGCSVLEVGCGTGQLLRWLQRKAAVAIGVDPDPLQLDRARQESTPCLVRSAGELLPFADGSFDVALWFNSLHHVPVPSQRQAIAESARVLRPGGSLLVIEPKAAGPWFELLRLVEDETEIRTAAQDVLDDPPPTLETLTASGYASRIVEASADAAAQRFVAANPERAGSIAAHMGALRERFATLGTRVEQGWEFQQLMQLHHFRRRP
jgi:SAM-dependent methyltransferase